MKKFVSFIGVLLFAVMLVFRWSVAAGTPFLFSTIKNTSSTADITFSRKTERVILKNTTLLQAATLRREESILFGERLPTIWFICLKPIENTLKKTPKARPFLSPINRWLSARISLR